MDRCRLRAVIKSQQVLRSSLFRRRVKTVNQPRIRSTPLPSCSIARSRRGRNCVGPSFSQSRSVRSCIASHHGRHMPR